MLSVKVFGPGCANCKQVERIARKAISHMAVEAEVVKITDYNEIAAHGVLSTPGLAIEDQVVCSGRIPTEAEVTAWIATALDTAG